MDLRRYELATLAAARRLRSSYCALAHGSVLLERFLGAGGACVRSSSDHGAAELDAVDVAVIDLADKVARRRHVGHAGRRRPACARSG